MWFCDDPGCNAGFLIGWHGDALVKMDNGGNKLLVGLKKAAQSIMDGYDAIDLGIKQKNDTYIQSDRDMPHAMVFQMACEA